MAVNTFSTTLGTSPVVTPTATSDVTTDVTKDVKTDVPLEAQKPPNPADYVKPVNPAEQVNPATPQSFYAKYVMPTLQDTKSGLPPINVNNADSLQQKDSKKYAGLCQRFVEDVTYGRHGIFDSAIDAWNKLPNKVDGLTGVKPGDLVYFSPNASNQGDGHVGIYEGNGVFKSATNSGIEDYNIGDWMHRTGQSVLGYVPV